MSYTDYAAQPNSPGGMSTRRLTNRNTNRYSVTALFSMAAEQDVEVEDELGRGMCAQLSAGSAAYFFNVLGLCTAIYLYYQYGRQYAGSQL